MAPMSCAKGKVRDVTIGQDVDAALPFLSFGAGLMTAAEIFKTQLPGYPRSANRLTFSAWPEAEPTFGHAPMRQRPSCVCASRSKIVHARMIEHSKYAGLSRL